MNRAGAFLLNLLYPNRCGCCKVRIAWDALLCADCLEKLDALRCTPADWLCCHKGEEFPWAGVFTVFSYESAARDGILAMKDGAQNFGRYAGSALAEQVRAAVPPAEIDCVTWVPVSAVRRHRQGYAHAELLGKSLAEALGRPANGRLLKQSDSSLRQHQLSASERAVFGMVFRRTNADLSGQTVLLTDDVLTTGSTMRRCTELLLEMGAARVFAAAAACRLRRPREVQPENEEN
ncbi:MAG: hypothetical protein K6E36_04760 [Oscillospiraceae bacterium]|nr:hypothetical protein [Oscillospiraceae bacterium]